MTDKKYLGNLGEKIAEKYLRKRAYHILANNYRDGHKELDIIGEHQGKIIAFEVKTRRQIALPSRIPVQSKQKISVEPELGPDECLTLRQTRRLQTALISY